MQMALSLATDMPLSRSDEQSVTYSSRAGSPPRTRLAAPGPNPGLNLSSRTDGDSFGSAPPDFFSQSGSYHEESMDDSVPGLADIPPSHLPSIADLGLPVCCENWRVTGQHGLLMVQCTPEDARRAFEVERASGRFCMTTAFAELAQGK